MWMKIKKWLWRRGLGRGVFYSPSAALIYKKGTFFHPGKSVAHEWALWSKSLSTQTLSKQNPNLDPKKED